MAPSKDNVVRLDALVRGRFGSSDKEGTMRVFRVHPSFVSGISEDGQQRQMYVGNFEVVDEPRPERQRTDIPSRLR